MRRTTIDEARQVISVWRHTHALDGNDFKAVAAEIDKMIDAAVSDALAEQRAEMVKEHSHCYTVERYDADIADLNARHATDKQRAVEEALANSWKEAGEANLASLNRHIAIERQRQNEAIAAERSSHSQIVEEARREENEACAKIADRFYNGMNAFVPRAEHEEVAKLIRQRADTRVQPDGPVSLPTWVPSPFTVGQF